MWNPIVPKADCSWEPIELRILKRELALMGCKCDACVPSRHASRCLKEQGHCNDEGVQVDQKNVLLNQYIYANTGLPDYDEPENMTARSHNNAFCPNCYFIWDLLRRAKKVFKDVAAEIRPDSADKSTEKEVQFVDSTTSVTNKSVLKTISSNRSVCDFLTDYSSESLSAAHFKKTSNRDKVTFLEDLPHLDVEKVKPIITMHGNCFCLENFVESIRPPDMYDYHGYIE